MSLSDRQLQAFANVLLQDEEAVAAVRERVQLRLFDKFRKASPAEREIINAIMDNESLFWTELKIILGEGEVVNDDGEEATT